MSETKTAKLLMDSLPWSETAKLYELTPPIDGNSLVAVSAVDDFASQRGPIAVLLAEHQICETYIFPADADGKVTSWMELAGSQKGFADHERCLREAGYEIIK